MKHLYRKAREREKKRNDHTNTTSQLPNWQDLLH
jgi:hypothetical protein